MLAHVKDYIKTHDAIRRPVEIVQLAVFFVRDCFNRAKEFYRRNLSKKYRNPALLKYKNIHEGKRCFIVATGPSLTLEDVNTLAANNEIAFGVNSCVKFFDKTSWRPTYYCVSDLRAADALRPDYKKNKMDTVFYNALAIDGSIFVADNIVPLNETSHAYVYLWSLYYQRTKKKLKAFRCRRRISLDAAKCVDSGPTVVFYVIQLALYMGFKEIYLLGTDCNYASSASTHSKIAEYSLSGGERKQEGDDNLISAYQDIKDFLDEHGGCNIYNASRGGRLEVFERVNFDSLFGKDSSGAEAT